MTAAGLLTSILTLLVTSSAIAQSPDRAQALNAINEVLKRSRGAYVTYSSDLEGKCRGVLKSQSKRRFSYNGISFDEAKGGYQLSATETYSSLGINAGECRYGNENSGAAVSIGIKTPSFADLGDVTFGDPKPFQNRRGSVGSVDTKPDGARFMVLTFGNGRTYKYLVTLRSPDEATELRGHFFRLKEIDTGS